MISQYLFRTGVSSMQSKECDLCETTYTTHSSLKLHVQTFHPDKVEELLPKKIYKTGAVCNECDKSFTKYCSLERHIKRFHPDKLVEMAPKKTFDKREVCNTCKKTFTKYSSLERHVKTFHPDEIDNLPPKKFCSYKCTVCSKVFSKINNFNSHKRVHERQIVLNRRRNRVKCPLCKYEDTFKSKLIKHFLEKHEITVKPETRQFDTFDEFLLWKTEEEKTAKSLFIKNRASQNSTNSTKIVYECHRSGNYTAKGKGKRRLKSQGSNKINAFCPASIAVTQEANDTVRVEYISTHVGHDTDLAHLLLDNEVKQELASKLAAKIPLSVILDEIRDSVSNTNFERIHLLTRKDLYNIEHTYNLNDTSLRQKNDESVSEQEWIEKLQNSNCILFYKPQDCVSEEYSFLKGDDFVLILMTEGQRDILSKFGNDCICVDGTHEMNSYGFELITLMVVDEMREGFPCSFMISNRTDEEVMVLFFSCIEASIESKISTKVFMSDIPESFYKAWVNVMEPPEYRLYCSWHVDRTWRKNLAKIASKETQLPGLSSQEFQDYVATTGGAHTEVDVAVYQQLHALLQEEDIEAFPNMLETFLNNMFENKETLEFGNYFLTYYVNQVEAWAYCYRLNSNFDANMDVERMHHTMKHIFLKSNSSKKLDKTIFAILKFVREKLLEQLTTIRKGKLSSKLKDLRLRHDKSQKLDQNSVAKMENGWEVSSSTKQEMYFVEQKKLECDCKIICPECNVCLHQYSCTCIDSSVRCNMCKHIHLVCRYEKQLSGEKEDETTEIIEELELKEGENIVIIEEATMEDEIEDLVTFEDDKENQRSTSDDVDLEEEKLHLSNWICAEIDRITSVSQLNEVKCLLDPIEHILDQP
nr:uncharacterized protein LOC111517119 isoform X1 [Leptinotarsa decemlineata]